MTLKVEKRLIQPNGSSYITDIKVFMVYKTDIILYLVLSDNRLICRNMPKTDIILYLILSDSHFICRDIWYFFIFILILFICCALMCISKQKTFKIVIWLHCMF